MINNREYTAIKMVWTAVLQILIASFREENWKTVINEV